MSSTQGNVPPRPGQAEGQAEAADFYESDLETIAEQIRAHQCILFLGSGIHRHSPPLSKYNYPSHKSPPVGDKLAQILASACKYPKREAWNLQRVSQYFEWKAGFRSLLIDKVTETVRNGREPSPVLRGLARLNFPIVITTNYDQLYEQALESVAQARAFEQGKSEEEAAEVKAVFDKCVYERKKKQDKTMDCDIDPSPDRPYLLKIHGDVDKPESIVITEEDYIEFLMRMNDPEDFRPVAPTLFKHLGTRPTLFIGYSLRDINVRLLFKTLRWTVEESSIPPTYSVDLQPDVLIKARWATRDYFRFIKKDLWHFVPDLYRAVTGQDMPP